MNRFSMTLVTTMMNVRKKTGAIDEPQVLSGTQSGGSRIVSNMILFQSSPVEIEKSREKLRWKLLKFLNSLMASPSVTL